MRDSFIFYRSFYEQANKLNKGEQLSLLKAICELALNEQETELKGISSIIYEMAKPLILANEKRFKNGCKGGRPKGDDDESPKKNIEGIEYFIITEKQYDSACERLGKDVVDLAISRIDSWFARKKETTAKDYVGRNNHGFLRADNSFVMEAKKIIEKENSTRQPNWSV